MKLYAVKLERGGVVKWFFGVSEGFKNNHIWLPEVGKFFASAALARSAVRGSTGAEVIPFLPATELKALTERGEWKLSGYVPESELAIMRRALELALIAGSMHGEDEAGAFMNGHMQKFIAQARAEANGQGPLDGSGGEA